MLTLNKLKAIEPNTIFAKGIGLIEHPWAIKMRDKNSISFIGEVGIFWIKNIRVVFDKIDYNKMKDIKWCLHAKDYIIGTQYNQNILMHHLIYGKPNRNEETDHINRDKGDNRKINLRFISRQQNQFNKDLQSNNQTGIKGVCFDNTKKKWKAYIKINQKQILLGYFDKKERAIYIRKQAENKNIIQAKNNVFITTLESDGKSTKVKWVAVRGGYHDWAIYHSMDSNIVKADYFDDPVHLEASNERIASYGAKLHREEDIKRFVSCDEEAFGMYRH